VGEGIYHYEVKVLPIYSFTDKLHCLINTATALLELLTDCSIRISRSFMTKVEGGGRLIIKKMNFLTSCCVQQ